MEEGGGSPFELFSEQYLYVKMLHYKLKVLHSKLDLSKVTEVLSSK